jgi:hypothetical protein
MHEAVVLDSGVHCVRCQLRDFRVLSSKKKKSLGYIAEQKISATLPGLYHTITLKS